MDNQNSRANFLAGFGIGLKGNAPGHETAAPSFAMGYALGDAAHMELEGRRALLLARAKARAWKLYPPEQDEPLA